jgi:hypothetical protein
MQARNFFLCFSTDDEPDSLFLHVSSPDEEQGLRDRGQNTPLTSPISSSVCTVLALLLGTGYLLTLCLLLFLTYPFTWKSYVLGGDQETCTFKNEHH